MSSSQASTRQGRWSELLLGGAAAGLGTPLLLGGLRRVLHLGRGSSPVSVGWAAGVMGALVAGGLARRRQRTARAEDCPASSGVSVKEAPALPSTEPAAGEDADGWMADQRREARRRRLALLELRAATLSETSGHEVPRRAELERGPRRGPSGREQPWHEALASTSG